MDAPSLTPPTTISLADLLRVARALDARGADLARLAQILGFHLAPPTPPAPATAHGSEPPPSPVADLTAEPSPGPRRAPPASPPAVEVPEQLDPSAPVFRLQPLPPLPRPNPPATTDLDQLLEPPPPFPLAEPTLLPRRHQRAILTEAAAGWEPVGSPDVERIVHRLARGRALTYLPRVPQRTQRRGAQVLLDLGDSMQPFLSDLRQLQGALRDTLGRDGLQILHFAGCPSRGAGPGPLPTWSAYAPPPPGVPVLAVTDLGLAPAGLAHNPAQPQEWERFADDLRRAGSPLIVWLPFPPQRVPARLRDRLALVHWHRAATARRVRRTVESAWRRL